MASDDVTRLETCGFTCERCAAARKYGRDLKSGTPEYESGVPTTVDFLPVYHGETL
jgi:hypothetical protein